MTDRFYIKLCVPSASAARATKAHSREIARARAGFSIKDATRKNRRQRCSSGHRQEDSREGQKGEHIIARCSTRCGRGFGRRSGCDRAQPLPGGRMWFGMEMCIQSHQLEDFTPMDLIHRFETHIKIILNESKTFESSTRG